MSRPRTSTCKVNRDAYDGVEAVIVSNLPNERGNVIGVCRGVWHFPRLPKGQSALPRVRMPRVRATR
jgi:hypothetical protein